MPAIAASKTKALPDVRFWDRIAKTYAAKPVADEAAYRTKLNVTRGFLRPEMEVFEFGCGTGSTALLHAPFAKHILATDISPRMIEIARSKADAAGVANVDFEVAAIEDLATFEARFDAVLGLSILHLIADKEAAIAKVHRLLKPGGVFVTSTACLGDRMWYFKLIAPVGRALGLLPMLRVFTTGALEKSLAAQGFEIEHRWQPANAVSVFLVARKPE